MLYFLLGILAFLVLGGVFHETTGLIGNTFYSPKRKPEPEKPDSKHRSFKMTKED